MALLTTVFMQIFGNFAIVMRFSVLWLLLHIPISIYMSKNAFEAYLACQVETEYNALSISLFVIYFVISWIVATSIAINWHRFILLEEVPENTFWPNLKLLTFSYIRGSIKIALLFVAIFVPIFLITNLLNLYWSGIIVIVYLLGLAAFLYAIPLSIRLSTILPAIALENPITIAEAYKKTKGLSVPIFIALIIYIVGISVLIFGLSTIYQSFDLDSSGAFIIFQIITLGINWISLFFGIGILTAIYGHAVEGRPFPGRIG